MNYKNEMTSAEKRSRQLCKEVWPTEMLLTIALSEYFMIMWWSLCFLCPLADMHPPCHMMPKLSQQLVYRKTDTHTHTHTHILPDLAAAGRGSLLPPKLCPTRRARLKCCKTLISMAIARRKKYSHYQGRGEGTPVSTCNLNHTWNYGTSALTRRNRPSPTHKDKWFSVAPMASTSYASDQHQSPVTQVHQ
jgi:hypothetical protein